MRYLIIFIMLVGIQSMVYSQCFEDRHSTLWEDQWVSCTLNDNPNASRSQSHWIMYDLGEAHRIGSTHFWNINRPGSTDMGIFEMALDYSTDGLNWIEWGTFQIAEAPATSFYEGEAGPDLSGIDARYLLLTAISTHGNSCAGLAEVRFESLGLSTSTEEAELGSPMLALSPNPARNITVLHYDSSTAGQANISIADVAGREVYSNNVSLNKGSNSWQIPVSALNNGSYIVQLNIGSQSYSTQLSIIKN